MMYLRKSAFDSRMIAGSSRVCFVSFDLTSPHLTLISDSLFIWRSNFLDLNHLELGSDSRSSNLGLVKLSTFTFYAQSC